MTIRFGELFAGVSGMGMGLERAGLECAWRVEWDRAAAGVLAYLYPKIPLECDVVAFCRLLKHWKKHDHERFRRYIVALLAGGSPCQDLSLAGKRKGLAGERSGLFRTMVRIARILGVQRVLWENVVGALSSNEGRDFACVIGAFTGCIPEVPVNGWPTAGFARAAGPRSWNVAWRVLDSQFFGVPQRRRRIFLVASLGEAIGVEILFEPESLSEDPAACQGQGEDVTRTLAGRSSGGGGLGTDFDLDGGIQTGISPTLDGRAGRSGENNFATSGGLVPMIAGCLQECDGKGVDSDTKPGHLIVATLTTNPHAYRQSEETKLIIHTLRGEGFDASEDGTGRGTPLVAIPIQNSDGVKNQNGLGIGKDGDPMYTLDRYAKHAIAFDTTQITSKENRSNPQPGDPCHPITSEGHPPAIAFSAKDFGADAGPISPTLRSMGHSDSHANGGGQVAIAFNLRGREGGAQAEISEKASLRSASGGSSRSYIATIGVRRLTPKECERLQGWPDDHTLVGRRIKRIGNTWIPQEGIYQQADGPRYKQAGNGVTSNVTHWIGNRMIKFGGILNDR